MAINFQERDKYESKHTGSWTNIPAQIGQTYDLSITGGQTDRKYIRKYMFKWWNPWCHITSVINDMH